MKSIGPGLLVALLVVGAVALGLWSWSAGAAAAPAAPEPTGAAAARPDEAPDEPNVAAPASDPVRSAASPAPAGRGAATADDATEAAEQPAAVHRVRGRVVDARGDGVPNARVGVPNRSLDGLPFGIGGLDELLDVSGDSVTTDENGDFDVPLRETGSFRLVVTHPEHPKAEHRGEASADVEGVVIRLRDGARITGRVVGAPAEVRDIVVFARPLPGALETASESFIDLGGILEMATSPLNGRRAAAGDDREFELRGLDPRERYAVWAANADESPALPVKSTARLELPAGTLGAELLWRDPLIVTVRAVAAETGAPVEQLEVRAGFVKEIKMLGMALPIPTTKPLRQREFPDGRVRIDSVEVVDGDDLMFAVELRADGRRPWIRHDIRVPQAGHVDLGVAALARSAVVVARVLAASGEPVAGAEVELVELEPDDDGGAEQGSEQDRGSISFSTSVEAPTRGDASDPALEMLEDAGARGMKGTTDDRGECRITAEFDGRGELRVKADGYAPSASEPFDLPPHGDLAIDVRVHRGGGVRVVTVDGHGAPAPRSVVQRKGPVAGDEATEKTDEHGVLEFEGLSVGEHTFKLLDVGAGDAGPIKVGLSGILDQSAGESVRVFDGVTAEITLAQPLRGDVSGYVTLDGAPLDNASVRMFRADAASEEELAAEVLGSMLGSLVDLGANSETDVDGYFEMIGVEVGPYRLLVNHGDLAMPDVTAVRVTEGKNRVDVAVRATTVRGRVVDGDGAPIGRATIAVMAAEGELTDLTDQMGDAKAMMSELFGGGGTAEVRTAADGTFELRGVRPGVALAVRATARMHVAGSVRVEAIAAGGSRDDVEIVLRKGGRVRISAVGVRGALSAKLTWAGTPSDDAPRDRDGLLRRSRVTVDGVAPGTWNVSLAGVGLPEDLQPRTVRVGAGETVRVDFGR